MKQAGHTSSLVSASAVAQAAPDMTHHVSGSHRLGHHEPCLLLSLPLCRLASHNVVGLGSLNTEGPHMPAAAGRCQHVACIAGGSAVRGGAPVVQLGSASAVCLCWLRVRVDTKSSSSAVLTTAGSQGGESRHLQRSAPCCTSAAVQKPLIVAQVGDLRWLAAACGNMLTATCLAACLRRDLTCGAPSWQRPQRCGGRCGWDCRARGTRG